MKRKQHEYMTSTDYALAYAATILFSIVTILFFFDRYVTIKQLTRQELPITRQFLPTNPARIAYH